MRLKSAEEELRSILNTIVRSQSYIRRPAVLEERIGDVLSLVSHLSRGRSGSVFTRLLRNGRCKNRSSQNFVSRLPHSGIVINQPDLLSSKAYEGVLSIDDLRLIDYSIKNAPQLEQLKSIFISFCSFSSPLVIDRLTQSNYMRFLKTCRIFEDDLVSSVNHELKTTLAR